VTATLDDLISGLVERVGVERACRALGTPARSYRHRQQARAGLVRPRTSAARARAAQRIAVGDERDATTDGSATTTDAIGPIATESTATAPATAAATAAASEVAAAAPTIPPVAPALAAENLTAVTNTSTSVAVAVDAQCPSAAADHAGPVAASIAAAIAAVVAERRPHPASLSGDERREILEVLCSDRFADLSPRQVFMTLLDEGTYLCSVRSMYRLLEDHGLTRERRRGAHQHPGVYPMPVIEAHRPNTAWTWDITKLRGPTKGVLYYLYTILDIFSRKVVGWTIALRESALIAEDVIRDAIIREGIERDQLTLHADRGGPMIAGGVAELLVGLGVTKSHSRPRVSNDNPYSEAQFKTMKYRPDYPDRFESAHAAHEWCKTFFDWYNNVHYHSGIGYLRPADLHADRHPEILEKRRTVLDQARAAHPERFRNRPALAQPPQRAWINKPSIQTS
jgi:putative transposase